MQNKTNILGYFVSPILLGLHWYTQHTAFLYLFGAMAVLFSIVLFIGLGSAIFLIISDQGQGLDKARVKMKRSQVIISIMLQVGALAYLLYASAFITATLLIVQIVLAYSVHGVAKYAIALKDTK